MKNKQLGNKIGNTPVNHSADRRHPALLPKCLLTTSVVALSISLFILPATAGVMHDEKSKQSSDLTVPPIMDDVLNSASATASDTTSQAQDANFDDLEAALQQKIVDGDDVPMPEIDLKKQKAAQKTIETPEPEPYEAKPELSLSSAILFALHDNPDISIALEKENQAGFGIDEAMAGIYPQVETSFLAGHEYNNPAAGQDPGKSGTNNTYGMNLFAEQLLFDGESTFETIMQKEQVLAASKFLTKMETEKIITDTIKFYLQIARYQRTVSANSRLINKLNGIVDKIQLMKEVGDASQAKVDYAKSRWAFAKSQLTSSSSALNDAIHNLETLTGKLPEFRATYPEQLEFDLYTLEEYLDLGGRHNSQVRVNETERHALEHQYNAEKGKMYPTVSLTLNADQTFDDGGDTPRSREIQASIETSYKIFDGWSRKATANKVKSQINEQDIKKRKIIQDISRDVKRAYSQLSSLESALAATEDEIASNRSLQELNLENFEQGNIDIIELIEGEERLSLSLGKKHELTSEYYLNMHRLMIAVGLLRKNYFCTSC